MSEKTQIQITKKTRDKLIMSMPDSVKSYDQFINLLLENHENNKVNIIDIGLTDEFVVKNAKAIGNSSGIYLPLVWMGKEVIAILKEDLKKD